jgi:hypothetical protein
MWGRFFIMKIITLKRFQDRPFLYQTILIIEFILSDLLVLFWLKLFPFKFNTTLHVYKF